MKTIELTDEVYQDLLMLKNRITVKTRTVKYPIYPIGMVDASMIDKSKLDLEPDYSFNECIRDIVKSVNVEQQTGKVNFIT